MTLRFCQVPSLFIINQLIPFNKSTWYYHYYSLSLVLHAVPIFSFSEMVYD
jgi:hypothetical protein